MMAGGIKLSSRMAASETDGKKSCVVLLPGLDDQRSFQRHALNLQMREALNFDSETLGGGQRERMLSLAEETSRSVEAGMSSAVVESDFLSTISSTLMSSGMRFARTWAVAVAVVLKTLAVRIAQGRWAE